MRDDFTLERRLSLDGRIHNMISDNNQMLYLLSGTCIHLRHCVLLKPQDKILKMSFLKLCCLPQTQISEQFEESLTKIVD